MYTSTKKFVIVIPIFLLILTKYYSGDQIENNYMGGTCNAWGERRGVYRVLMGKHEGKRPLGRPRRRWEDNIKIDL